MFDQEPMKSLVLSRSKVSNQAPLAAVPPPFLVLCVAPSGLVRPSSTPHLAWGEFQEIRVLAALVLCQPSVQPDPCVVALRLTFPTPVPPTSLRCCGHLTFFWPVVSP